MGKEMKIIGFKECEAARIKELKDHDILKAKAMEILNLANAAEEEKKEEFVEKS